MITNERQYRITKVQREELRKNINDFDFEKSAKRIAPVIAKAELEALKSEFEILTDQLKEYEVLKSGAIKILRADSFEKLPNLLIRARIAKGLSQSKLANILGLKEQQIQRYESDDYASASLRRLIEISKALEINISEVAELKTIAPKTTKVSREDLPWDAFPIKEMYRRNWFKGFTGSLKAAMANAEEIVKEFVLEAIPKPAPVLMRRHLRMGNSPDPYALLAWQCRVVNLTKCISLDKVYTKNTINKEWLIGLAQESAKGDGPNRARDYLKQAGIPLIIEPHLSQTYLDGAAILLSDGTPVVGMTLRYDRLDNFWFVLFHELLHVMKHLRKGQLEDIFDDLDAEPDDLEREADKLAGSYLIPEDIWETALARYIRSEDSVQVFAKELNINPAIVAGRIRKEAENYTILNELVGHGKVRKHFPEILFAQ